MFGCLIPYLLSASFTGVEAKTQISQEVASFDDITLNFLYGYEALQQGDSARALIYFRNIQMLNPAYVEPYEYLIESCLKADKPAQAAYYYQLLNSFSANYSEMSRLKKAIQQQSVKFNSDGSFTVKINDRSDLTEMAVDIFDGDLSVILSNNPGYTGGSFQIKVPVVVPGYYYILEPDYLDSDILQQKMYEIRNSIAELKEENLDFNSVNDCLEVIELYHGLGRVVKAIAVLEMAYYINPEIADLLDSSMVQTFLDFLSEQLSKDQDNPLIRYYFGVVLLISGDQNSALTHFLWARDLEIAERFVLPLKYYIELIKYRLDEKDNYLAELNLKRLRGDFDHSQPRIRPEVDLPQISLTLFTGIPASLVAYSATVEDTDDTETPSTIRQRQQQTCELERRRIEAAVDQFNSVRLLTMDPGNLDINQLIYERFLDRLPICPNGGSFQISPDGLIECSVHGKSYYYSSEYVD